MIHGLKEQLLLIRERSEIERYGRSLTEKEREANERLERQEEEAQKKTREAESLKEWVSSTGSSPVVFPTRPSGTTGLRLQRRRVLYGIL